MTNVALQDFRQLNAAPYGRNITIAFAVVDRCFVVKNSKAEFQTRDVTSPTFLSVLCLERAKRSSSVLSPLNGSHF